ncbi:ATP-binding protein [Falsiroseomonas oryziterrae]|uniref:ATP-binding protein n=1 Tax=Falsiroseomonas oryziterrae TaxID=2911368 RepID=UPI001F01525F|nr:ATP-binding protein [Roseomonas sp. NPKOSM-4]
MKTTAGYSSASYRVSLVIVGLVLLFLAALVGLRVDTLRTEHAAAIGRAEAAMRNLSRVAEQYAERVFETSSLVTERVQSRVAELGGADALRGNAEIHHWLRDLQDRSAGDYVMVTDSRGIPVSASYAHPAPQVDLSDRRWFRAHLEGAETHVGEALYSRITNEILFTFTRMLRRPDGGFDGVVQVAIRTSFFQQTTVSLEHGPSIVMGLFDIDGRVLARTGLREDQVGTGLSNAEVLRAFRERTEGTVRHVSPFGGQERILAFRRLADWPVVVTASIPVETALAGWRRSVRWSLEVIGSVAFGLLLLAALAIRMANRAERTGRQLAIANAQLRETAAELEARVEARTRDLRASETRFRGVFDSTFQFMAMLATDGTLLAANRSGLDFADLKREEAVGRPLWEAPIWHDAAQAERRLREAVATARAGTPVRYETTLRGGEGRLATIDFSLKPVRDEAGDVVLLVAEGHDLTELKAAETRLREAQKMEALGQLTGGVAHDFNNLLMVVIGNLGLLRKRLPPDARLHRLLDGAQQGAERGAALTQRMLAFARRQELRPAPADLAGLVGGLRSLLERSAGPTVRIDMRLPDGLPPALVDANQLELALLNLVVNARDAMPQGGTIEITAAASEAPSSAAPPGLLAGSYLRLALRDTGFGMDAATLSRATEPFFTTKGVGRGSGLGLSMVQGLAQQSGGGLKLFSAPGEGTTVEIWLPRAPAAAAVGPAAASAGSGIEGEPGRCVLVVDDDPLVAAGTAMMLEDMGHITVVANSAEEALQRLDAEPGVELVLTDHAMPGMTGLELAEHLRRERPDLPVVLATGYAESPGAAWLPRLNKPYRQDELAALVRRLTRAEVD